MVVEKMLAKGKKIYAVSMDLEKAYDRNNWMVLLDVLKEYGVDGSFPNEKKAFFMRMLWHVSS